MVSISFASVVPVASDMKLNMVASELPIVTVAFFARIIKGVVTTNAGLEKPASLKVTLVPA